MAGFLQAPRAGGALALVAEDTIPLSLFNKTRPSARALAVACLIGAGAAGGVGAVYLASSTAGGRGRQAGGRTDRGADPGGAGQCCSATETRVSGFLAFAAGVASEPRPAACCGAPDPVAVPAGQPGQRRQRPQLPHRRGLLRGPRREPRGPGRGRPGGAQPRAQPGVPENRLRRRLPGRGRARLPVQLRLRQLGGRPPGGRRLGSRPLGRQPRAGRLRDGHRRRRHALPRRLAGRDLERLDGAGGPGRPARVLRLRRPSRRDRQRHGRAQLGRRRRRARPAEGRADRPISRATSRRTRPRRRRRSPSPPPRPRPRRPRRLPRTRARLQPAQGAT